MKYLIGLHRYSYGDFSIEGIESEVMQKSGPTWILLSKKT